ncbi:MAG TPA: aspartate ammonia-lyase [Chthonomonadaceae bacterium]|nr:aspartate ammonia-lyase [Chthonomonadaceae bacterium]
METRIERDSLGEMTVPADALYGASTARAVANFPVSGLRAHPAFLWATLVIKKAAAQVNREMGEFRARRERDPNAFRGYDPDEVAAAIIQAADAILRDLMENGGAVYGKQFVVDVYQAGAGTSHNMNVNEVVANLAIERLGGQRGDRELVDPNDHVNMGQSTNDVIPTAMRLAALRLLQDLYPALDRLADAFAAKGREFHDILKSGRTHLQDAVPMRLGQEFAAWAVTVRKNKARLQMAQRDLEELGIGGNAIGTGINTQPDFPQKMTEALAQETGFALRSGANLIELCQNTDAFVTLSAALRTLALDLNRIANDLRLLASGPNTGLAEIVLPAVQPGSSIMPGKVNPVMAEMLNMVCYQVIGNDTAVALASQAGQLELNVMMPVMAHNLNQSLTILTNAITLFAERCVAGITADAARCRHYLERSMGLATVLNPLIGYIAAARVVKRAEAEGKSIKEVVLEEGLLTAEDFDRLIAASTQDTKAHEAKTSAAMEPAV